MLLYTFGSVHHKQFKVVSVGDLLDRRGSLSAAIPAKAIAEVISKYRRLVRLQQYKVFKEDGGVRQHV